MDGVAMRFARNPKIFKSISIPTRQFDELITGEFSRPAIAASVPE
jgi:hypothetical protein